MKRWVIAVALVVLIVSPSSPARAQDQVSYESALGELHKLLGSKYPCFRLKKIDWEAVGRDLLPKAKEAKDDESFGLLCMQMVARLEDSHAVLQPGRATLPQPPLPSWDGGFACLIDERDRPVVYWIDPNGPAAGAGLKVGSVVVSVNGENAADALSDMMKLLGTWYGFSSDRVLQYDAARWLGRQMNKGDAIKLVVEDPSGGAKREMEIRATAQTSYIPRLPVPIAGIPDSRSISFTKLQENIGYLRVRRISNDLEKGIDAAPAAPPVRMRQSRRKQQERRSTQSVL